MPADHGNNVIPLGGSAFLGVERLNPDVTAFIQNLSEMAARGEILGIAVAITTAANSVTTDWEGGTAPANLMVAAVAKLQHRVLAAIDDADPDNAEPFNGTA